jgi:preprotein translocase subunit SecD
VLRFRPVVQTDAAASGVEPGGGAAPTDPNAPAVTQEDAANRYASLTCDSGTSSGNRPQDYVAECSDDRTARYLLGPAIIEGTDVRKATASQQETTGEWVIVLTFDDAAQATWSGYTASNIGNQVAFTLDGQVVSAPTIQSAIDGPTTISGNFTEQSAKQLARQIGG